MKKKDKFKLIKQLLILFSETQDFLAASKSVNKMLLYFAGHPKLHQHRYWMEEYLYNKKKKRRLRSAVQYLQKKRLIKIIYKKDKLGFLLTEEGKKKVLNFKYSQGAKNKLPDNQYLMIFFDIPEKIRVQRDILRNKLKQLGCEQIQKSIWVTPHDIQAVLRLFIKEYKLENHVKLLLVKEV